MDMDQQYAVQAQDVTVAYDTHRVLWDVDFYAPKNSMTAIVGPNGGGKTTLLKALLNIVPPLTGTIQFVNKPLHKYQKNIAYVPQKNSVDWNFPITVLDIVLMGRYTHTAWYKSYSQYDKDIALQALKDVKMSSYYNHAIHELSGGQQQRIFLARALAQQAEIYIMDEPFIGIDAFSETMILNLLKNLKQHNKTIIVVHHNLESVKKHFDWVAMINTKHIAIGPTEKTLTPENITRTFQYHKNIRL